MKTSNLNKLSRCLTLLFLLLIATLFLSCDQRGFEDELSGYRIVSLVATQSILLDDNGTTTAEIEVLVHNGSGQPAAGQVIRFSSSINQIRIEPPSNDGGGDGGGGSGNADPDARFTTNGSGIVKAVVSLSGKVLSAGADSVSVNIFAWLNTESRPQRSLPFTIVSTTGVYLRWVDENPVDLSVTETGGNDSAIILVKVVDMAGNLVTATNRVRFRVRSGPGDMQINGQPHNTHAPIVSTDGGMARVQLTSGQLPGTVNLEAELLNANDEPLTPVVMIRRTNIVISAGPPAMFDMYFPHGGTGRSVNAGAWQIVLGANISDAYFNPVRRGTGVSFSLENLRKSKNATPDPLEDIVNPLAINGSATVFNVSVEMDSTAGVAYTYMTYHGTYSNYWVDIVIDLGTEEFVPEPFPYQLPMQSPTVTLSAFPEFIQWEVPELNATNLKYKYLTLLVKVQDGQSNPIFNAPIHFTNTAGITSGSMETWSFRDSNNINLVQMGSPPDNKPWEDPTDNQLDGGPIPRPGTPYQAPTDENGEQKKLFFWDRDLFDPYDTQSNPIITTSTITIEIIGWENTSRSIEVQLKKWQPPQ